MSQPMTDAEREQRVAEIRKNDSHTYDVDLVFLLAERDRLKQELDRANFVHSLMPMDLTILAERLRIAEAKLAKERERVAYLTGSIESRGGL